MSNKTNEEYINQYPNSAPLRELRASIIGQLLLKELCSNQDLVKEETDAV